MSSQNIENNGQQFDQKLFLFRLNLIDKDKLKNMVETFFMIFGEQYFGNAKAAEDKSISIEEVKLEDMNKFSEIDDHIDLKINDLEKGTEITSLETSYTQQDDMLDSEKEITTKKQYECSYCRDTFKKKKNLNKHLENIHALKKEIPTDLSEVNIYKCSQCDKTFTTRVSYKKHRKTEHSTHTEKKEMLAMKKCYFCEIEFDIGKSNLVLITHLKECHSDEDVMGVIVALQNNEIMNVCNICGKQFRTKHILSTHTKTIHNELQMKKCDFCDIKFNTVKSNLRLITHLKNIHSNKDSNGIIKALEEEGTKITCNICGKKLRNKYTLASHMKLNHSNLEIAPCHICGKLIKQHENIIYYHMQSHNDFPCEYCPAVLGSKSSYRVHKAVHLLGSKHFGCDECDLQFDRKNYLTRHKQRIHTAKNNEHKKCDICGKTLTTQAKLRDHVNAVHLQKKPFCCDLCEYRTARKDNLTTHRKGKHGIQTNLTEIENDIFQAL